MTSSFLILTFFLWFKVYDPWFCDTDVGSSVYFHDRLGFTQLFNAAHPCKLVVDGGGSGEASSIFSHGHALDSIMESKFNRSSQDFNFLYKGGGPDEFSDRAKSGLTPIIHRQISPTFLSCYRRLYDISYYSFLL